MRNTRGANVTRSVLSFRDGAAVVRRLGGWWPVGGFGDGWFKQPGGLKNLGGARVFLRTARCFKSPRAPLIHPVGWFKRPVGWF